MATTFEPLGNRVVVIPDPTEDVSDGGIIIPDVAKNRQVRGTVVAVGPGAWRHETKSHAPMGVEVGDRVLYGKYAGTDIMVDDMEYVVTTPEDILGKIRTDDEESEDVDGELLAAKGV